MRVGIGHGAKESRPDVTEARRVLGYVPSVDLAEGPAATFDWYVSNQA